jgi:Outer membrane protein beta-barrel domain
MISIKIKLGKALFIVFLLFFTKNIYAQTTPQRFKAGIIAGITASQIDGDLSAGYNKLGLQGGLRGIILLKPKQDISLELLFSQRGAASALVNDPNLDNFAITLNYVEIPVQWHYKDWLISDEEKGDFYRMSFNAGLSFARLIGSKVNDDISAVTRVVPDLLEKTDLSFVLGTNIWANHHLGFTVRYVRSFGFMYNPKNWVTPPFAQAWNGHTLNFQTVYVF